MIVGLKVDVCTYDGLRRGVPNLLRLLDRQRVRGTFCVAMGPDTTGRAIVRILRPGFLEKLRRTRAIGTYGLRTILSGTLLPPRHMGRDLAHTLREVVAAGHELAVHGYDHRRWQDGVHRMGEQEVREELARALAVYGEATGTRPRGFGAPGWQVSAASLRVLDEIDLAYSSDTRGGGPFYPLVEGRRLRTLQLPTTFPTLDETLGLDDPDGEAFVARLCRDTPGQVWGVVTLHAEMEGVGFQSVADHLLAAYRREGVICLPLVRLADRIRAEAAERIPAAEIVAHPIRGRAGTVAMPATIGRS